MAPTCVFSSIELEPEAIKTPEIKPFDIINHEQQKEKPAANQFFSSLLELQAAMDNFMNLEIALYRYEDEELPDFVSAAEELLLDVELQLNINIDREWFKKALILRRENYRVIFG